MGNYIKYIIPCLKNKNRFNTKKIDEGQLDENDSFEIKKITNDEFYCPECDGDDDISEILKIHSDNGKIEFKCIKRDETFDISFKEYCEKAKQKTKKKCYDCIKKQLPEPKVAEKLCLGCGNHYCPTCGENHTDTKNNEKPKNIFIKFIRYLAYIPCLYKICRDKDEHKLISIKEISSYCLQHKLPTTEICKLCEKNVCDECLKIYHKWHDKIKIDFSLKGITNMITNMLTCSSSYEEEILEARKIIYEKGQKLLKMNEFYKMVKSASVNENNNKTYKDNLTIVSKCIENENKRDNKEIDLIFYKLEQMKNNPDQNNSNNINNDNNAKKEDDINLIKDYA